MAGVVNPVMGAERVNRRVRVYEERFRKTYRMYLRAFQQDGFLPLTERVSPAEELAQLDGQEALLWQQASMMGGTPQGVEAQRKLQRLFELREKYGEP